jgi:transcriptional regulator with XRE-family HTH domain
LNLIKQNIIGEKLGLFLKYERMRKHISIAKIAMDLNLNPSTIVSIEHNKHQASFTIIYLIVIYLEIDKTTFFEMIGEQKQMRP